VIGGRGGGRTAVDVEAERVAGRIQSAKHAAPPADRLDARRGDLKHRQRRIAPPAVDVVIHVDGAADVGPGRNLQVRPMQHVEQVGGEDGGRSPASHLAMARERAGVRIAGADLREPRLRRRRRLLLCVRAPADDRAVARQTAREPRTGADRYELGGCGRRLPVAIESPARRGPVVAQAAREVVPHGEAARRHDHRSIRGVPGIRGVARAPVGALADAVLQRARIAGAETCHAEDGQDPRRPNHAGTIRLSG